MDVAYPAALGCEAQLNSYCASACRLGGSVFLARYDRSETDESVRWRCYAQETLSTDTQRFVSGTTYCTRDSELQGVLAANGCIADKPVPTIAGMMKDSHGLNVLLARIRSTSKIAVVGSSGNLLYRNYGAAIDRHDVVFRMNAPSLAEHEGDVGHDTHIRIGWDEAIRDANHAHLISRAETTICAKKCRHNMLASTRVAHGEVIEVADAWVSSTLHGPLLNGKAREPSTGFVALGMAIALARHVLASPPARA